jgi:hypothetical protein
MTNPKFISLLIFATFLIKGNAQDSYVDTTLFTVAELQEDFNFWRNQLEKDHPILYQYNSKESFENYFDSLYAEIDGPMSRTEFFRLIGPSSFFIKCVHSQVMATPDMKQQIVNSSNMLPIDIRWYSDVAYVSYNYTGISSLNEGTIIKSINDITADEMYAKALSLLPRDGNSTQYPKYWVNRIFYYYYHLWFDFYDSYKIEFQTDEQTEFIDVPGMNAQEMNKVKANRPKIGPEKPEKIQLKILDSIQTAYLQIGSFTDADIKKNNGKSCKKMLDSCFLAIKNSAAEFLIIDLQENGGGNPNSAWYLCRFFMNQEFIFKTEFRKIADDDATTYDARSKQTILKDRTVGTTKPLKNNFTGELFLLIDGGSSSASGEVASVVERYKRGIIIGEEAGGSPSLISSRWFYVGKNQLPNTKLIFSAPKRTSVMGNYLDDTGHGTIPDYVVDHTIHSYLAGEDLAFNKAIELIRAKLLRTNK